MTTAERELLIVVAGMMAGMCEGRDMPGPAALITDLCRQVGHEADLATGGAADPVRLGRIAELLKSPGEG